MTAQYSNGCRSRDKPSSHTSGVRTVVKIYYTEVHQSNTFVKKFLNNHRLPWQSYDERDFSNGHRFVFPDEPGLLIMPWEVMTEVQSQQQFVDDLKASNMTVYFASFYDCYPYYKKYLHLFEGYNNVYFHLEAIPEVGFDPRVVSY